MLSSNELRINNIFNYGDGELTIDTNVLRDLDVYLNKLNPIPLTEEWLVKFGFELDGDNEYIDDRMNLSLTHANELKTEWYDNNLCVDIKHVHSLQNLYFALTSEELIIKE